MEEDDYDPYDTYGIVLMRRREGDENFICHIKADGHTLHSRLEVFVTRGVTTEILGYYQNTTPRTRTNIYYDTREAEGREYP